MACGSCVVKKSRNSCKPAPTTPCCVRKTYATKRVCCGVSSCKSACTNQCKLSFKNVKILVGVQRVPCCPLVAPSTKCCKKKSCDSFC